jgi:TRAP-type uncharacterized transport system fused permease subunit
MLVFSFGLAGLLAPPVTSAAYTADSMAGSRLSCTGWQAMNSSTLLYILPFIFVYKNGLLLAGKPTDMIISVLLATGIGISVHHRVTGCSLFQAYRVEPAVHILGLGFARGCSQFKSCPMWFVTIRTSFFVRNLAGTPEKEAFAIL